MQSAGETRTDERLDDLSARVDRGFDKVDLDIRELRADLKSGHETLLVEMNAGNEALRNDMNTRFDRLQQMISWFGGTLIAGILTALVGGVATTVLTGAF